MNNKLEAIKEHGVKLENDEERMRSIKLTSIRAQVTKCRADKVEATSASEQCEKDFIRDLATASELESARAKINEISERLIGAERLEQLVISELQNIEREMLENARNIQVCHREYCLEVKNSILNSLNSDAKIRTKLIEAYVSMIASGGGYSTDWGAHLKAAFSNQPTQSEIDVAFNKFITEHGLIDPHTNK